MTGNEKAFGELSNHIKEILLSEEQIKETVCRLGKEITEYYSKKENAKGNKLLIVGILKGSILFLSDLIRKIELPLGLEFMRVSSYGNGTASSGVIEIKLAIDGEVLKGADVLVLEDILDSGKTLSKVMQYLSEKGAKSVKLCTFLDKPDRRVVDVPVDFRGEIIPDEFVVGYGLDFDEKYRNLPFIGVLKPEIYENN